MSMNKNKKWTLSFVIIFLIFLLGMGAITIIVDPYFHYHKPLPGLQYPIDNQRYQNDGIIKNFDYDAIITGTSMTENFKVSELNELFNVKGIKVSFSGATHKEINDRLLTATQHNSNIKMIIRSLDYSRLLHGKDTLKYEESTYPEYLYDDLWYNDIKYFFNKSVLFNSTFRVLEYTQKGNQTTDFDEYSNWMKENQFGKDIVLSTYERSKKTDAITQLSKKDYDNIKGNITQNITNIADDNPNIEFYLFFTPYSICYWDQLNQEGTLDRQIDAEKYTIELILPHKNIHIFSFSNNFEMTCNLDHYKDIAHYDESINSKILKWMKEGKYELTTENYNQYIQEIKDFYSKYPYDSLFNKE